MHQLSPYATQCLAALQQLLPDLVARAIVKDDEFTINTTSPSGWPLWLSSEGEGLIVGFAEWHGHFDWHESYPELDAAAAASLIQEFRSGQLQVAAWYTGDQYAGAAIHEVGIVIESPTWLYLRHDERRLELRRWAD